MVIRWLAVAELGTYRAVVWLELDGEQGVHRARAQTHWNTTALVARAPVQWMLGLSGIT